MQPPRERRNEAGLYLEIEIDPDRIRIVGAARIPRVARIKLHPPVMTPERIGEYRTWAAERVLAVLDPRGDLIDRFGWSAAGEAFFDRPGEEEDLRGSPGPSRQVREVLRVPTDERAAFLCFYGTQTGRRADGALIPELEYRLLGLYALGSGDLRGRYHSLSRGGARTDRFVPISSPPAGRRCATAISRT